MVETQEPIWPSRIFIPVPVGDLSSPVHRRMATPLNLQSADGAICVAQTICFDCGFAWEIVESAYDPAPMQCPNCSEVSGIPVLDVYKFGRFNQ